MATDDDGLCPARNETRHVAANDRFAENHATENIADCPVRGFPHFLELEFLNTCFIRCDRGAFDADAVFVDRVRGINRDLVIRCVTVLDREVIISQVDIEIGVDQLVADIMPDNSGHFIAIEFDDGVCDFDLRHGVCPFSRKVSLRGQNPSLS